MEETGNDSGSDAPEAAVEEDEEDSDSDSEAQRTQNPLSPLIYITTYLYIYIHISIYNEGSQGQSNKEFFGTDGGTNDLVVLFGATGR